MTGGQDSVCVVSTKYNDKDLACGGILVHSKTVRNAFPSTSQRLPKIVLLTTAHTVGDARQSVSITFQARDSKYTFDCNPSALFVTCCEDSPHVGKPCPKKLDYTFLTLQDKGNCCTGQRKKPVEFGEFVTPLVIDRAMPIDVELKEQYLLGHYNVKKKDLDTIPIQVTHIGNGSGTFYHDGSTSAGSSGGAITIDGRLVGMHTGSTKNDKSAVTISRILMHIKVIPEDGYENIITFLKDFSGKIDEKKEGFALDALLQSIGVEFSKLKPKDRLEKVMKNQKLLAFMLNYFSLDNGMESRKVFLKYGVQIFDVLLEDLDIVCCHPSICKGPHEEHNDHVGLVQADIDTLCKILDCIKFSLNHAKKDDDITRKHAFSCASRFAKLKQDEISNNMRKGGYFSAAYNAIRGSEDKELRNLAADTFFYNFDFLNVKLEKLEQSQIDIQATSEEKIKEKDLIIEGLHGKLEKLQKSMIVMQDTLEEKIKEKESEIVQLNRKTSRMKEEQEKALKESQDSYKKKIDELKENNDKLHQDLLNQLEQLQTPTQERGQNECASLSDENNASLEAHDGQRRHTGNFQPASTLPLTADQVDCAEEQGTIGDMHINHLKLKMKHKLYNELNLEIPGSGCGYQHLAEHLGMPPDEIMYLTQNNNPARAVLEWWSKSKETTISNLHKYLIKIGYTMLAKELADYYNLE